MPGIECVNLLAFIQILVTADFALFFIDENGYLTKLYNKFIKELKEISSDALKEASITENRALKSHLAPKDRITIARLRDVTNRIKYLTDRAPDYDGWSMLGLYGGIYGLVCLFVIGLSHSQSDFYQREFLLVFGQVILALQSVIVLRLMTLKTTYQRNIIRIILLLTFVLTMTSLIVLFDAKFAFFHTFEIPFVVFSMLILLMPYVVAIVHIIYSFLRLKWNLHRCQHFSASLG